MISSSLQGIKVKARIIWPLCARVAPAHRGGPSSHRRGTRSSVATRQSHTCRRFPPLSLHRDHRGGLVLARKFPLRPPALQSPTIVPAHGAGAQTWLKSNTAVSHITRTRTAFGYAYCRPVPLSPSSGALTLPEHVARDTMFADIQHFHALTQVRAPPHGMLFLLTYELATVASSVAVGGSLSKPCRACACGPRLAVSAGASSHPNHDRRLARKHGRSYHRSRRPGRCGSCVR